MNRRIPKQDVNESTRDALLRRAESLLMEHGYAKTSIDELVRQEQLTKGAFYYYFKDKRAIFEQVVDRLLLEMVELIGKEIAVQSNPWQRSITALETYLDGCLQPAYRVIVLQEAPVILGWTSWREKEKQSVVGLTTSLLQELMEAGIIRKQPVHIPAQILFGGLTEAAIGIAEAADRPEAREHAKRIMEQFLKSL